MTHGIKLGDKVRILRHRNYFGDNVPTDETPTGRVIVVSGWDDVNEDGERGDWRSFTSVDVPFTWFRTDDVEVVPVGPVVTETVAKTRIVPGTYGRVTLRESDTEPKGAFVGLTNTLGIPNGAQLLTADELDAAAAVLSALAKGLRDA